MTEKRNSSGQFANGNKGGPGRPRRIKEAHYLASMTEVCTPDDWQSITKKAVEDAKQGDTQARSWLSRYLLGDGSEARPDLYDAQDPDATPQQRAMDEIVNE